MGAKVYLRSPESMCHTSPKGLVAANTPLKGWPLSTRPPRHRAQLALGEVETELLVVLLVAALAGLGELALFHALADVPVDERTLGVHEA